MDKKDLPIIPPDRADDLHNLEIADSADLVLFMAGNQFMAMDELIAGFQQEYPDVKNIFYETLPSGLELKQILSGGAVYKNDILIDFILSSPAQQIYQKYGFVPYSN